MKNDLQAVLTAEGVLERLESAIERLRPMALDAGGEVAVEEAIKLMDAMRQEASHSSGQQVMR